MDLSDAVPVLAIALGVAGSVAVHSALAERSVSEPPDTATPAEAGMRVLFAPLLEVSREPPPGSYGGGVAPAPRDGGDLSGVVDAPPVVRAHTIRISPHGTQVRSRLPDAARGLTESHRRSNN